MPVVQVKMLEGRSQEQKEELVRQITDVFINVANAKKEAITVIIEEHSPKSYAVGGVMMADKK